MNTHFCKRTTRGSWLALGIGTGVALGVATNNLALWIALGTLVGLALGARNPNRS